MCRRRGPVTELLNVLDQLLLHVVTRMIRADGNFHFAFKSILRLALEDQRSVQAAKCKRIGQGKFERSGPGLIRHNVEGQAGSALVKLTVGGMMPCRKVSKVAIASMAPAAPRV